MMVVGEVRERLLANHKDEMPTVLTSGTVGRLRQSRCDLVQALLALVG
jgi:hypothetical protein